MHAAVFRGAPRALARLYRERMMIMASLDLVRQRLKEYAAVTSQAEANRLVRRSLGGIARENRHRIVLGRGPDTSSIEKLPQPYYMEVVSALYDAIKQARFNAMRKRLAGLTSTNATNALLKKAGGAIDF